LPICLDLAEGFDVTSGFASNGYGAHSPGGYSFLPALVTEVVMTIVNTVESPGLP
jgi:hypothetical protein